MAWADRPVDRRGGAARRPGGGSGDLLLRLRPDGAEPAHRQPGPDPHAAPAAAGRAPPAGARRGRDRADRRPAAGVGALAELAGRRRRLGAADPLADRALPGLLRPGGRAAGEQPRLDGAAVGDRLPARRRQALPGEPDAGEGRRGRPAELRRGDLVHGVQLPDPPGHGLPGAVPALRVHAADRRLGPVGQPDRGDRPHPPRRGRVRARAGDAAGDQGGRHQVRQDRERHRVARPRR